MFNRMEPSTSGTIHSSSNSEHKNANSTVEHTKSKRQQDQSEANKPAAKREKEVKVFEINDVKPTFNNTNEMLPISVTMYHDVQMKEIEGSKSIKRKSKQNVVSSSISHNESEFVGIDEDSEHLAENSRYITSHYGDLPTTESCSKKLKKISSKEMDQLGGEFPSTITTQKIDPSNTEILAENTENIISNLLTSKQKSDIFVAVVKEPFTESSRNITTCHSDLAKIESSKDLEKIETNEKKQFHPAQSNNKNDPPTTLRIRSDLTRIVEAAKSSGITTNHTNLLITESCNSDLKRIEAKENNQLVSEFHLKISKQKNDTHTAENNELEFVGGVVATEPVQKRSGNVASNYNNFQTSKNDSKDSRKVGVKQLKDGLMPSIQKNCPPSMPNTEAPESVTKNKINITSKHCDLSTKSYSKNLKKIDENEVISLVRKRNLIKTLKEKKYLPNKHNRNVKIKLPTPVLSFNPVYKCVVIMCNSSNADLGRGVTFHTLVGKSIKEWLKILNLHRHSYEWAVRQKICSKHFVPGDFFDSSTRLRLRPTVMPTRFLTGLPDARVVLQRLPSDVFEYHQKKLTYDHLRDIAARLEDDLVEQSNERPSIAHEHSALLYSLFVPDQLDEAAGDYFIRQLHSYSYNPVQLRNVSDELRARLADAVRESNATAGLVESLKSQLINCKHQVRRLMKLKRITPEENLKIFSVLADMKELWSDLKSRKRKFTCELHTDIN